MTITVCSPTISGSEPEINLQYDVVGLHDSPLLFSITGADRSFIADTLEPALVGLLLPAMMSGQDLRLKGVVSEELLYHVTEYIVPLLNLCVPAAQKVRVHAESTRRTSRKGVSATVTGLSNGIDSFCASATHLSSAVPAAMRITHFIFHDTGSHGDKRIGLADARLLGVRATAEAMQRPLIYVKTNLGDFYKGSYQQTHTVRSAAVAFALGGRVKRYLYASTYPYSEVHLKRTRDIASIDPILLPLLKSESMECFSVGAAQSRVEKTARICSIQLARKHLDVCVVQWPNCSCCWKCCRSLLTLELLGEATNFASAFDLKKFSRVRDRYVAHVIASARYNPLNRELVHLMRSKQFPITLRNRIRAIACYSLLRLASVVPTFERTCHRLYRRYSGFPYDR
jgi:hypothetical protein